MDGRMHVCAHAASRAHPPTQRWATAPALVANYRGWGRCHNKGDECAHACVRECVCACVLFGCVSVCACARPYVWVRQENSCATLDRPVSGSSSLATSDCDGHQRVAVQLTKTNAQSSNLFELSPRSNKQDDLFSLSNNNISICTITLSYLLIYSIHRR